MTEALHDVDAPRCCLQPRCQKLAWRNGNPLHRACRGWSPLGRQVGRLRLCKTGPWLQKARGERGWRRGVASGHRQELAGHVQSCGCSSQHSDPSEALNGGAGVSLSHRGTIAIQLALLAWQGWTQELARVSFRCRQRESACGKLAQHREIASAV